jgi:hypothetical protein
MRANYTMFWILAGFFVLADVLYTVWSVLDPSHGNPSSHYGGGYQGIDWVGTLAIGLTAVLAAFIGFFMMMTYRAQKGELPEDRLDATIEEGDAEQGFFSPWSWWPIMLAGSVALLFTGLAVGPWICFIGGAVTVVALIGWHFEYYRGIHAH